MGTAILGPVLPDLFKHFADTPHVDYLAPLVLTMPSICIALFSTLAGFVGDKIGRRRFLLVALTAYGFVGVAPMALDSLVVILVSRFVLGLTEAVILTMSTTMIVDYFKGPEREKWLAYQTALAAISAVVFSLLGGMFGGLGWRGPFIAYSSSLLMFLLVWLFTHKPDSSDISHNLKPVRDTSWRSVLTPRLIGICAISGFASVIFFTLPIDLGMALHAVGLRNPAAIGGVMAVSTLGIAAGTLLFRVLASRPPATILAMAFGLAGVGFVTISHVDDFRLMAGAAFVNQVGCGIALPTLLTWSMRDLPFEARGRSMGIFQSSFAAGQFFSAIAITAAAHAAGGVLPGFQILGAITLGAALLASIAHWAIKPKADSLTAT
jgi:MFS family permease